jgi:hypothetical protein
MPHRLFLRHLPDVGTPPQRQDIPQKSGVPETPQEPHEVDGLPNKQKRRERWAPVSKPTETLPTPPPPSHISPLPLQTEYKNPRTLFQEFAHLNLALQGLYSAHTSKEAGITVAELFYTATDEEFDSFKFRYTIPDTYRLLQNRLADAREDLKKSPTNSLERIKLQQKIGAIQLLQAALASIMK